MTNPNNAVRVSSRNGGRGSVYEANAWAQLYTNGILSGNGVTPDTGMTVKLGGTTACPDVAIAKNASGYMIGLDIVDTATITLTRPASNQKVVSIVAYTNDLSVASTESNITGNPASCGLIPVDGTVSSSPHPPTENQIRTAITADGGTGSTAAYSEIARILVTSSTTSITSGIIVRMTAAGGLIDVFYPVGSYYETSATSFDPNKAWGGTWTEDATGRVLVSRNNGTFSTVGSTGGEETHTITIAEMPTHDHNIYLEGGALSGGTGHVKWSGGETTYQNWGVSSTGGGGAHNNLQPYIVVKRWHRIA